MKLLHDNIYIVAITCSDDVEDKSIADTLGKMLVQIDKNVNRIKADYRLVTTLTTRHMKAGETQGVEHIFLSETPEYEDGEVFAISRIDGEEYWTTCTQIRQCEKNIYVMSPSTMKTLMEKRKRMYAAKKAKAVPDEGEHAWPWTFDMDKIVIVSDDEYGNSMEHNMEMHTFVSEKELRNDLRNMAFELYNAMNRSYKLWSKIR